VWPASLSLSRRARATRSTRAPPPPPPPPALSPHPPPPQKKTTTATTTNQPTTNSDYRTNSRLDAYEAEGLDSGVVEDMGYEEAQAARAAAEATMARRDAERGGGGRRGRKRMPGALEELDDEFNEARWNRMHRPRPGEAGADDADDEGAAAAAAAAEGAALVSADAFEPARGSVADWVANDPIAREVKRRFEAFLRTFRDDKGDAIYEQRIRKMVTCESFCCCVRVAGAQALKAGAARLALAPRSFFPLARLPHPFFSPPPPPSAPPSTTTNHTTNSQQAVARGQLGRPRQRRPVPLGRRVARRRAPPAAGAARRGAARGGRAALPGVRADPRGAVRALHGPARRRQHPRPSVRFARLLCAIRGGGVRRSLARARARARSTRRLRRPHPPPLRLTPLLLPFLRPLPPNKKNPAANKNSTWHLGNLIKVRGVVTRRSGVFPQLRLVRYDCGACGEVLGPFAFNGEREARPAQCPACGAKGPFTVNAAETLYQNYQKLTLQEAPGSVPPGRLPRHKEVVLLHDLIDCARPGEEVEVTGVYCSGYDPSLNARNGFPVFSTHVEANSVSKAADEYAAARLTDEERAEILRLAADPRIGERIVRSMAPSIYGHENIKTGLALALFGGVEKGGGGSHRLRGDINCLLLGDPGTAKSQFLKYVEKTSARAVYTTGKGASAVGLTAAVHRDAVTREWTLEGGALVLADRGVCLIDEFDKMNDQDRVSIHEAMEQQSISISKAGIVTSLQARCSVVAAANPVGGRYDPSRTFAENVELSDPILSRFDVLCVVRDVVDPVNDERLAEFVVGSHAASHPSAAAPAGGAAAAAAAAASADPDLLPQATLRKYITYARQHCRPRISQAGHEELLRVYARLRAEAHRTGGMPVAVRHLESMIRMAEAHARMHLRDAVTSADMAVSIRCMVESFVSTQKASAQRDLRRRLRQYVVLPSDYHRVLLHLLRELAREKRQERALLAGGAAGRGGGAAEGDDDEEGELSVPLRSLEDRARELDVADVRGFLESAAFREAGFRLDADRAMLTVNA